MELGASADDVCPHCDKPVREWDGHYEESEEIDVISREFVKKTIKRKKARCECCRTIVTAPLPPKLFPGARYSIAFAALVVVSKYVDHLPLERQVKMMKRDGLDVESQTLWDYTWAMAQLLKPTHQRLLEYVLGKRVVGADETWWRLMGAKAKSEGGDGSKWWIWSVGADDSVCYRLEDSRSAEAAARLLGEYAGTVICDELQRVHLTRQEWSALSACALLEPCAEKIHRSRGRLRARSEANTRSHRRAIPYRSNVCHRPSWRRDAC